MSIFRLYFTFTDQYIHMKQTLLIISLCFIFVQHITAQQDVFIGQLVELRTEDGNTYVGEVLSLTESDISIQTAALGEITLKRSAIKKVIYKNIEGDSDNNGIPIDYHNSTHYFISPSAFSLQKGQSYYENIGVFFNSYSVGLSNHFTLSGGLELISPLFLQRAPSLYVSPKFSIPFGEKSGGFSVGSTFLAAFGDGEAFTVGVLQASVTLGNRNNNFTIGTGLGYSLNDGISSGVLPMNLSGMWRLSNKISFVTDNFIFFYDGLDDAFGLLSAGLRIHFEKNGTALNLGLGRPTEDAGDLLALPFVSATIPIQ